MEIICTEAPPLSPSTVSITPMPHASVRAPSLWATLGLIATYFLMQALVGTLFVLVASVTMAFSHAGQGLDRATPVMLAQPSMQALLAMLSFGLAASLTLWLARWKWPQLWPLATPPGFGFTSPARPWFLALAVAAGLTAPLLGGLLTQLLAHDHTVTQDIQQLGGNTPMGLRIPLALVVVSLGPLVEEMLFRGVLLSALLQRWHVGWAVAISSLAFALIHLPGLQFQWYALPDLALLALALAWLRLRSDSIWPAVVAHAVNNLLAVTGWFVALNLPG
ncbi:MAG TPA: CPBP family intramembrane glutamic endopeptidase [Rhodanobacter sp.]|jgi:membrane protease YdiL (CAAX protease family)|nr:CPBP family intramembrane glutamic endopeptidase [Rhodanobacter sp.]